MQKPVTENQSEWTPNSRPLWSKIRGGIWSKIRDRILAQNLHRIGRWLDNGLGKWWYPSGTPVKKSISKNQLTDFPIARALSEKNRTHFLQNTPIPGTNIIFRLRRFYVVTACEMR